MSKNIRQKIAHALQSTFRSSPQRKTNSSNKLKITSCCLVKKPLDYDYVAYEPTPILSSTKSKDANDYVDLSECQSWSMSDSSDSGVSFDSNVSSITTVNDDQNPLHSTQISSDNTCSMSTISHLSYIPHDQLDITRFDVSAWYGVATSYECCHCQCHHQVKNTRSIEDSQHRLPYRGLDQTEERSLN